MVVVVVLVVVVLVAVPNLKYDLFVFVFNFQEKIMGKGNKKKLRTNSFATRKQNHYSID